MPDYTSERLRELAWIIVQRPALLRERVEIAAILESLADAPVGEVCHGTRMVAPGRYKLVAVGPAEEGKPTCPRCGGANLALACGERPCEECGGSGEGAERCLTSTTCE